MRLLLACVDAVILNGCFLLAFWLRFDDGIPLHYLNLYFTTAPWMTAVFVTVAYGLGLYNRIWEYASLDAAMTVVISVAASMLLVSLILFAQPMASAYPRSVLIMGACLTVMGIGASRFGWRAVRRSVYHQPAGQPESKRRRVLIYGAGSHGVALSKQASDDPSRQCDVVGFLDSDPHLRGMYAAGTRVLGTPEDLPAIAAKLEIDELILAEPCIDADEADRIFGMARAAGLKPRTLPRFLEMLDDKVEMPSVRDVNIGDIIGRSASCPDLALPSDYIRGQTILVTGAGGSIGSEICRQLCRYGPARVVLLGRGENRIHRIYYDLRDRFPKVGFDPVICNVTSAEAVEEVLRTYRPSVIFHAAAHKHVFLMEYNPVEAVRNNVLGTATLTELADKCGVDRFVLVSTDKATEPTSVMGATKRFCERIAADRHATATTTKFMTVRFGNVIGSAGSVVPIFQAMAEQGKSLTVTDPEADRYFMTIEEAAFLVLQAGALGEGGEVFVLDMGSPVKIVDIARTILRLHGRNPDAPGAIEFIGLRPGEKLHEDLVNPFEKLVNTAYKQIRKVTTNGGVPDYMDCSAALDEIRRAVFNCDESEVLGILARATDADFHETTVTWMGERNGCRARGKLAS